MYCHRPTMVGAEVCANDAAPNNRLANAQAMWRRVMLLEPNAKLTRRAAFGARSGSDASRASGLRAWLSAIFRFSGREADNRSYKRGNRKKDKKYQTQWEKVIDPAATVEKYAIQIIP